MRVEWANLIPTHSLVVLMKVLCDITFPTLVTRVVSIACISSHSNYLFICHPVTRVTLLVKGLTETSL